MNQSADKQLLTSDQDDQTRLAGFEMKDVNFEMLREKRVFLCGADKDIRPVPTQQFGKKNQPIYSSFAPLGDVLPIEPCEKLDTVHDYAKLFAAQEQNED